ncbi:hypothetical protein QBC42DRAFT_276644, partial [Cladorrhinum samala]
MILAAKRKFTGVRKLAALIGVAHGVFLAWYVLAVLSVRTKRQLNTIQPVTRSWTGADEEGWLMIGFIESDCIEPFLAWGK